MRPSTRQDWTESRSMGAISIQTTNEAGQAAGLSWAGAKRKPLAFDHVPMAISIVRDVVQYRIETNGNTDGIFAKAQSLRT
ncbi:hypothetical protein F5Y07DRAFT_346321 [Xylaria sp. FL0933]|nr:hypothetical protein F5Y07DRAFT_346321 [Xylaria sp. FL0933]